MSKNIDDKEIRRIFKRQRELRKLDFEVWFNEYSVLIWTLILVFLLGFMTAVSLFGRGLLGG